MRIACLALALGFALACSTVPPFANVHGPGTVFSSLDAAAVDALAYAHERAQLDGRAHLMHGGVIVEARGGFSYDGLIVASPETPHELTLVLRQDAVAHFRTYPPTPSIEANRSNERVSEADRQNVDEIDPRHRPAYVLTPTLVVRVYRGEELGVDRIARVRPPSWSVHTARR